jgi:NADH:ubiquinone oxidoreductase subunit 6 (subunit J)
VKQFLLNGKLLNVIMALTYTLFIITILLLLVFALKAIFTNIKSSTKTLVVIVVFAVVIILGYLLASPELTPSAIKMQLTSSNVKWIGAGMFVFYVAFFGAICAIIYAAISGAIKNRK